MGVHVSECLNKSTMGGHIREQIFLVKNSIKVLLFFTIALILWQIIDQRFSTNEILIDSQQINQTFCPIRKQPATISKKNIKAELGLTNYGRPIKFFTQKYTRGNGGTVTDKITGLMWQQSGSNDLMPYTGVKKYIEKLNEDKIAGHNDWRMPTLHELITILSQEQSANSLYIHPDFNSKQKWVWSSDSATDGARWLVDFFEGTIFWGDNNLVSFVRAVRCNH
ncbi:MAG: DUF1566 domain-containing protein [Desulfobacula sp.]|nr:DUF1566 domain-containing protein [Desulfobacula sp.]